MKKVLKTSLLISIAMITSLAFTSCKSEYERRLEKELASGVRYDSLFLGFKFGMKKDEFYTRGWELNKQKLVKEGPRNATIQYSLDDFSYVAKMNFYPKFYEGKLYRMPVTFNYDGYSVWNKDVQSDKLLEEVLGLYKSWYGDDFIKIEHPEKGPAYVRIDGNRRISIFIESDREVGALFTDLIADKEKLESENASN